MIWCQVITAIILMAMVRGYNYCNNRTHKCVLDDKEHFMCRLHSFHPLGGSTKYHAIVPDLPEMQNEILSILNKFRNAFASGDFTTKDNKTFASAKRMRKIMWDKELAYMARTHASTVSFQHSECRSTLRFPYVGECLAMMTPKKKPRIRDSFKKMFKMMFEEYLEVEDPDGLLKGFDPIRDYKWAHFTNIISDRVSRVGCGLAVGSNCHQGSSVKN
ncbi:antigen 5 like allergen Cul n 1-like isoform X2 [Drosophila rhopaloa]|uniref:Venom allergen 5.01-like isoform X2 n=1 Tax=Drosophila rhopaloa TaxID=1041015 RepID=A0A6P4E9L3_DRORH|nr:antigen 5 like allergen Cul n 1-like isoform X2 [Drosophila rhopaloa]